MFLRRHNRRGVSLVELLMAVAVMGILAISISTLATAVHSSNEFAQGRAEVVQHARVACERIENACGEAYATPEYPGFWAIESTVGSYTYPDALVVWKPDGGTPANADGPPLMNELVVFAFDSGEPNRLLEMTAPLDASAAPAVTSTSTWISKIDAMQNAQATEKVQLTDLLRVGNAGSDANDLRGVVRFETRYHPSMDQWTSFQAGALPWNELTWPQSLYGNTTGVRQSWCRIELQLVPRGESRRGKEAAAHAIAFFGSATLLHSVSQ